MAKIIIPLLLCVATTAAQQAVYGQCGGSSWTGATTCATGSTCVYQNAYYSSVFLDYIALQRAHHFV